MRRFLDCQLFSDMYISKGTVAMRLSFRGFFNGCLTTSLRLSLMVKECWKSVNIFRRHYGPQ